MAGTPPRFYAADDLMHKTSTAVVKLNNKLKGVESRAASFETSLAEARELAIAVQQNVKELSTVADELRQKLDEAAERERRLLEKLSCLETQLGVVQQSCATKASIEDLTKRLAEMSDRLHKQEESLLERARKASPPAGSEGSSSSLIGTPARCK